MEAMNENNKNGEQRGKTLTMQELKNSKSSLTREINWHIKEIAWITRNDNNGLPISKWYLGKLREPQLLKLKRDLKRYQEKRKALDRIDYSERLGRLMKKKWNVSDQYITTLLEKFRDSIQSCALNEIALKDAMMAVYKLDN